MSGAAIHIGYSFGYGTSQDTSGTPGNATVTSWSGTSAWAGAATQCTISNAAWPPGRTVQITPIEETGALATARTAVTPPSGGSFTANRSTGSILNQRFHWEVRS